MRSRDRGLLDVYETSPHHLDNLSISSLSKRVWLTCVMCLFALNLVMQTAECLCTVGTQVFPCVFGLVVVVCCTLPCMLWFY
jgi:hypothetical protein